MSRRDLLVVGGGPAGATLAALAAARGLATTLVERARFPRDKVCGEFVSAEGCRVLERLGVLEQLVAGGASRIGDCRITGTRGAGIDLPLPDQGRFGREALGVTRARMDQTLLEHAAALGVDVRGEVAAVAPILERDRVRGMNLRRVGGRATEGLSATLVVAADGRRSLLARLFHPRLGDPTRSEPGSRFGFKTHVRAVNVPRIELHLFDGGYVGLGPVEGGRVNVCMLASLRALRACGGSPGRLLSERVLENPAARSALAGSDPSGNWCSIGPLHFGVRRPSARGALFVGDAAGTIDPFCGEGMTNALLGAELALPVALEAVAGGGLSDALAASYDHAWRRAFGPVTRRVRRIGRLFERPRLASPLLTLVGGARLAPRLVALTRTGWGHA